MKPLAFDLFAGIGGWSEGLLAEGFNVIGFDIEAHDYGDARKAASATIAKIPFTLAQWIAKVYKPK